MNEKRELMKRAGWSVHQRSSHVGIRWDFSAPGKDQMDSRILDSEERAWLEAEIHFHVAVQRARTLLAIVDQEELVAGRYFLLRGGSQAKIVREPTEAEPTFHVSFSNGAVYSMTEDGFRELIVGVIR